MSTKEYTALWRRLNPYYLSHVTRQGFRDHNVMAYNSGGMQEFHNGFLSVIEDEKMLRPPLALTGLRTRDETAVKDYLSLVLQAEDESTAKDRLIILLNHSMSASPRYPDKTAVHFAPQIALNDYYGGETGNEVFFSVSFRRYGFAI